MYQTKIFEEILLEPYIKSSYKKIGSISLILKGNLLKYLLTCNIMISATKVLPPLVGKEYNRFSLFWTALNDKIYSNCQLRVNITILI